MRNTKNQLTRSKIEEKLINLLDEKLSRNGFEKFSMDELANELHISKKTIYKSFPTKEELVRKFYLGKLDYAYSVIVTNIQAQSNIVEKFVELSKMIQEHLVLFNNVSMLQLKHYHPELANELITFRNERVIPLIKLLLRVGRKKKLVNDIGDEIIIKVFTTSLGEITRLKKNYEQIEYQKIYETAFEILLNGILTKKGRQLLINKRIKNGSN
ncbi:MULTISPECIES: TetR/AcrR family transcriptional regulator [unclassified Melioribacter]|uniref:TetR/AcrR family transcriptional regulator n=1 Tax=unclassified Melioribacter TaxID=2627329 RepID=UPI003BC64154